MFRGPLRTQGSQCSGHRTLHSKATGSRPWFHPHCLLQNRGGGALLESSGTAETARGMARRCATDWARHGQKFGLRSAVKVFSAQAPRKKPTVALAMLEFNPDRHDYLPYVRDARCVLVRHLVVFS